MVRRKWVPVCCLLVLLITGLAWFFHGRLADLPGRLHLSVGEEYSFPVRRPFSITGLTCYPDSKLSWERNDRNLKIIPGDFGEFNLSVSFLGLIPVRTLVIDVSPEISVIPGGQSIGILLAPSGLIVVDHIPLTGADGSRSYPARDAGIAVGDIITRIEDQPVQSSQQVRQLVALYGDLGRPLLITLRRGGKEIQTRIKPVKVRSDTEAGFGGTYLLGLWLEDPAAGIGTLTFYDPRSGVYGALGHMVTDSNNNPVKVADGRIVKAYISGVRQGAFGRPGEKIGTFRDDTDVIGYIHKNTVYGVFGRFLNGIRPPQGARIKVARAHEVTTGPARILTVLQGDRVESFDVRITTVNRASRPSMKNLVIEVVDPELLRRTGGIVQGMSGSPIIQQGRLVGAITHVFVNDPTKGYGILADWMLQEASLITPGSDESGAAGSERRRQVA